MISSQQIFIVGVLWFDSRTTLKVAIYGKGNFLTTTSWLSIVYDDQNILRLDTLQAFYVCFKARKLRVNPNMTLV